MRLLPRSAAKASTIEGSLDGLNGRRIHGWARDTSRPHQRLVIEILAGGSRHTVVADDLRHDLLAAGKGDGRYGFTLVLGEDLAADATVSARIAGSPHDIAGSPVRADTFSLLARPQAAHLTGLLAAEAERALIAARSGIGGSAEPRAARGYATRARIGKLFGPEAEDSDPEGLVTRFMAAILNRHRIVESQPTGLELHDRLRSLQWYLTSYVPAGSGLRPLSRAQIRFLNRPAPVLGLRREFSIAAYSFITAEFDAFAKRDTRGQPGLASEDLVREALFWWAERSAQLAPGGELITDEQVEALASVPGHEASGKFALSDFAKRVQDADQALSVLDMTSPLDRAVLVAVILFRSVAQPHLALFLPRKALADFGHPSHGSTPALLDQVIALALEGRADAARQDDVDCLKAALRRRLAPRTEGDDEPASGRARQSKIADGLDPGVAAIGPFAVASGLGQAARLSVRAMQTAGLGPAVLDFHWDMPSPRGFGLAVDAPILARPRQINLIHLNADTAVFAFSHLDRRLFESSYNILFCFWELDKLPTWKKAALELCDEVWVASEFCREVFARETDVPVVNVGTAVEPKPRLPELDRARFGIGPDDYVFLTVFDSFSFVQRKNPSAVVEAFRQAFPSGAGEPVHLVLKTQNRASAITPGQLREWRRVDELARGDPRITVIDETFDYPELLAFKMRCDCYVSLHRSEGLGFGLIEAMQLGIPVIATAYSGNMGHCSPQNSLLVDYELVPVAPDDYIFVERGSRWAEPSIASAAACMRNAYEDRPAAARRAAIAAEDVRQRFSLAATGARYKARIAQISDIIAKAG